MTEQSDVHPLSRFLFIGAAIVFMIWGISQAQAALASSLVSVFFALLATPTVLWLEKKRLPTGVAVAIVVVGMIVVLSAAGLVVGASMSRFYTALPEYQEQLQAHLQTFESYLAAKQIPAPEEMLRKYVKPEAVVSLAGGLLGKFGSVFANILLILVTVTFILLEISSFPVKLRSVLGDPREAFPRVSEFIDNMQRYMIIKTLMSLATGAAITVWLYILDVDFPILWGFLAFLLNYVPTLGSAMAGIPASAFALLQHGVLIAFLTALGFMVSNFVIDTIVEKRLMGQTLGLSTMVVFLSLIFWGSLLGPVGAILCIPLTITLKFALEGSESTQWVAVFLGPAHPAKTKETKEKT